MYLCVQCTFQQTRMNDLEALEAASHMSLAWSNYANSYLSLCCVLWQDALVKLALPWWSGRPFFAPDAQQVSSGSVLG